jgi:NADH-quinone oxidoreductase subunit G
VPNAPLVGKSTEQIRAALESGELKSVILFGVDPLRDFPDSLAWARALAAADHVVAFSMFETLTTAAADVVFPIETHAEKDGTVTHPDGRLQRVRPSASRPGDIRPNLQILSELSAALGHNTSIDSQPTAFAALANAVPFYAGIDDATIGGRGVRWQETPAGANAPSPGSREPGSERVPGVPPASGNGGLQLGTYRDLWAGPITELNPPLKFLQPQQHAELSAADAERLGLKNGDEVEVANNGTVVLARIAIRERQQEGVVFLAEGTAANNANALLNGGPVSVEITKVGAA